MTHQFLIDESIPNRSGNGRFVNSNPGAKRFLVDEKTTRKLLRLVEDHPDLYESQRRFAEPPFPVTYVEFVGLAPRVGCELGNVGVFRARNEAIVFSEFEATPERVMEHEDLSGSGNFFEAGTGFATITNEGIFFRTRKGEPEDSSWDSKYPVACVALTEILWLLMHQPKKIFTVRDVSAGSVFLTSPPRFWKAHSTVTIDLSEQKLRQVIYKMGVRNKAREHSVRGTWVHFHMDPDCEHAFPAEPTDRPDGGPTRYDCPKCGAIRVWRKDHERGNGKAGTKFHDYKVTS
jgi:hypothetical protein